MKKTIALLITLIQVLFMTSCTKQQSGIQDTSSIDATSISQKISAPCYAIAETGQSDGSWTYSCLSFCNDRVFYVAGKEDACSVRSVV